MQLLMIAPPGGGKGTQAKRLAEHFGIQHISSGELLREEIRKGTALGRRAQRYVERGDLVPDEVIVDLLLDRVIEAAAQGGYILDGFPRNRQQAEAAAALGRELGLSLDAAINLEVPDEEVLRRLRERAQLEGRPDDSEDTIRHRLEVYRAATRPLLEYYDQRGVLINVDGARPPDEVTEAILAALPTTTNEPALPTAKTEPTATNERSG
jgi:adenylate kinase